MIYLAVKALLSGIIIAVVSEIARRQPTFAALIASLPLVSILAMIWLYTDTGGDNTKIADHAFATFFYVLPSLPMFLILPALLKGGMHFYLALALSCAITIALYVLMVWGVKRFGIML